MHLRYWLNWVFRTTLRCIFRFLWMWKGPTKFLLPPVEDPALLQPASTLALWIRQRKRSAESIVQAFIQRIKVVNPFLNAVVDDRFDAALQEAREVDRLLSSCTRAEQEQLASTHPLLGVPFTAKESIMVKGMSHTGGLLSRKGIKAAHDAQVVHRLKEAGAIPLAVTAVPELGLWLETYSAMRSPTNNPYDLSRTAGGSSGGEGALLSSCGTPLSIGTDIGGSIRAPSFCCGTFGHKPTSGLVSLENCRLFPGASKIGMLVAGPLCRYPSDLILALESMAPERAAGLRARVEETNIENLKIWWAEDVDIPTCTPTDQALRETLQAAVQHLHTTFGAPTKRFQWPLDMADALSVWINKRRDNYKGDPPICYDMTNRRGEANLLMEWLRWICGRGRYSLITLCFAVMQKLESKVDPKDSPHYWKPVQDRFLDMLGQDGVLLLPVLPRVATFHYEILFTFKDASFTCIFNATEMPGTAVPLGLTKDGLPLVVQVMTAPNNDHLSLAVALALEKKFGGWVCPSPINVSHS